MVITYLTSEDLEPIGQELDLVLGRIAKLEQNLDQLISELKQKNKKE